MSSARQLLVRINEQPVGTLSTQDDIWRFAYAPEWLANPQAFALAPGLPLSKVEYVDGASQRPVQWYFDNLLPEEQLRIVLAKEAKIDEADAFGLLGYFGAESAGSLVLAAPDAAPAQTGLAPLPLAELDARIRNLPRATLTQNSPKRMSLAGAQHKMVVVYRDGELFEPLPGTPSTHILKPDSQSADYPHSVINEYFSMRLAAAAGLNVPAVHHLFTPEPAYIVERFDRRAGPDGSTQRLHIIDTCQLLAKSRAFKYEQATLDTLAQAVEQCTAKALTRLQLYRWLVFNYLLGNGDNHLKNISFHISHEGVQLAPAYDLLCTTVYDTRSFNDNPIWPKTPLALSLGHATKFEQVNRTVMLQAGVDLGLAKSTAMRELDKMLKALPAQADQLLAEIEASYPAYIGASPNPEKAAHNQAGELRLLRAVRHVILQETLQRLQ
ncbi:MAG: HipA domain-containing protein [Comamonas sp.]|uniref:HipA domain-containing protein n=1 Tax=Comamonas sp. TaxID=34028 RepID=UPI002FC9DB4B